MTENSRVQLGTIGALTLSVVSSVSILICNKALMSTLHFIFATTLTNCHLLVTFCSLHVALWLKFFEHKPIESQTVIGFGILNGISIRLLNLSLGFNSVGFYQMTKLAIIPCTVLLETLFLSKTFRWVTTHLSPFWAQPHSSCQSIKLSLMVLLLGVGIATFTDLQLNILGSALSSCSCHHLYCSNYDQYHPKIFQGFFNLTAVSILPLSSNDLAHLWLLTNQNVFSFNYTPKLVFFIVLSCLISVSVNYSTFLVIGKTSPITYQVLGHLKTCLVLAFDYVLLSNPFSWRNIFGIMVALVGKVMYSYYCVLENQKKASEAPVQPQLKVTEPDSLLHDENGTGTLNDVEVPKGTAWKSNKDFHA